MDRAYSPADRFRAACSQSSLCITLYGVIVSRLIWKYDFPVSIPGVSCPVLNLSLSTGHVFWSREINRRPQATGLELLTLPFTVLQVVSVSV